MQFRDFATSEFGTHLWMDLGRWLSPTVGRTLARAVSGFLARRRGSSLYRTIYDNQEAVRRGTASPWELDRAVRSVLAHAGRVSYDLMRLVSMGDEALCAAVTFGPEALQHVEQARAGDRGVMLCGPHMSSFNLGFLSFALRDMPLQILLAKAEGGYEIMEQLLNRRHILATQVGPAALREALRRLRGGGMVITGVDWPEATGETEYLPFFGRPARLPTGHIRMAISTGARLLPVGCRWEPGTGYRLLTAPPLELELTGDRTEDVRHNALRVLQVCERWITERPEQWLMYYPVWGPGAAAT